MKNTDKIIDAINFENFEMYLKNRFTDEYDIGVSEIDLFPLYSVFKNKNKNIKEFLMYVGKKKNNSLVFLYKDNFYKGMYIVSKNKNSYNFNKETSTLFTIFQMFTDNVDLDCKYELITDEEEKTKICKMMIEEKENIL